MTFTRDRAVNGGSIFRLQHHLDTRFAQLHTSVALELWQEAFRFIEDVLNLLNMTAAGAKKPCMEHAKLAMRIRKIRK
ncbi:hypothetical protein K438DRAFT_1985142 [Mycena galopus ATCC 62051]|nr:hypothetical protein K438DRAFT_1985142 [Mycena galopus ATCC 62051]